MGREGFLALTGVDACVGWLAGLLLVVVGAAVMRRHHTAGGILVGGAGAVKLLVNCCGVAHTLYGEVEGGLQDPALASTYGAVMNLLRLTVVGLVAGAAAVLARELRKRPGGP